MSTSSQEKQLAKSPYNVKAFHAFDVRLSSAPVTIDSVETAQEAVTHKFLIKKPNASERDESSLIRSQYTTKFIEQGLLPEAVLRKKLSDLGGIISRSDTENYVSQQLKLLDLEREIQLLTIDKKDDEAKAKVTEWNEVKRRIISFETEQNMSLENSAEAKARDKMIQYYIYQLLYWLPTPEATDYVPYFKGEDFEAKTKYAYEVLDDNEDKLYLKVFPLAQLFISYMLYSRGPVNEADINALPKEMGLE